MEKLGVEEVPEQSALKQGADKKTCPSCGTPLRLDTNVRACATCGTKPFEENHGDLK